MKQADILIVNARVLGLDGKGSRAEALAIAGNKILFAGDGESAKAFRHSGTRMFDAQGASVLPGFIESHMHIFGGSAELDMLHLTGVADFARLAELAQAYAQSRPEAKLLVAQGADYTILSKNEPDISP